MSLRALASLAVKLLGLYLALGVLPTLALVALPFVAQFRVDSPWTVALVNTVSGALQVGVGLSLLWFSDGIAEILVKDNEGRADTQWTELAFAVLGLYFAADAAAHLVRVVGVLLLINYPPNITVAPPDNLSVLLRDALPQLVRGGIGLWILLGTRGIVRGVGALKNVGRDAEMEESK